MKQNICRREFLKGCGATAVGLALAGRPKIGKAENLPVDKVLNVPSYLKDYKSLYLKNPHAAALEWFKNAKFGLFIHYGLYSILGREAWALKNENIPLAEYEKLKDQFTAEKFDADFITDLALKAGMKYVNITSRHHDSFCLFRSAFSDYNSVNSPAKRDLVAELAEQCQKKQLGLFLYYSYALDWRHPYFFPSQYCYVSRFDAEKPEPGYKFKKDDDFRIYIDFVHNQITELLTNYGPIAGMWFDPITPYYARPDLFPIKETYAMIRKLQPQTLISFKQGATGTEDFASPERSGKLNYDLVLKRYPDRPLSIQVAKNACEKNSGKHNEICDTLQRRKWGYYAAENENHLNAEEVMQKLANAQALNCNLLLNTGPLPDGSIHKADVKTLPAVGKLIKSGIKGKVSDNAVIHDANMCQ